MEVFFPSAGFCHLKACPNPDCARPKPGAENTTLLTHDGKDACTSALTCCPPPHPSTHTLCIRSKNWSRKPNEKWRVQDLMQRYGVPSGNLIVVPTSIPMVNFEPFKFLFIYLSGRVTEKEGDRMKETFRSLALSLDGHNSHSRASTRPGGRNFA